jgi:hypothetical protein
MKSSLVFLFLFLFFTSSHYPQNHYLLNSNHIPLMGYEWATQTDPFNQKAELYQKLKEMGLEGMMFSGTPELDYHKLAEVQDLLKIIPYQGEWSPNSNAVVRYTDCVYSVWQVSGVTDTIKATLWYNPLLSQKYSNNEIITDPYAGAGTIVSGPGYAQKRFNHIKESNNDYTTRYNADFRLKVSYNPGFIDPPLLTERLSDTVCNIKLWVYDIRHEGQWRKMDSILYKDNLLTVADFNLNEWKYFPLYYDYKNFTDANYTGGNPPMVLYVEYHIDWSGIDYLRLHFDSLIVYDPRGWGIMNDPVVQNHVKNHGMNIGLNGSIIFDDPNVDFQRVVAGFYGIDEPRTIDSYAPIKKVGELLRSVTQGNRPLFVSLAKHWNSRMGDGSPFGTQPLHNIPEFYYRARPDGFILQTHMYNSPYQDNDKKNIDSYILGLQDMLEVWRHAKHSYFVLVQAGKWLNSDPENPGLVVDPDTSQINYTIYLALLYGAKGIFLDQLFTTKPDFVTGIINPYVYPATYKPSYDVIKNKISPQLKGMFGKKLKLLSPLNQYPDLSFGNSYNWINSINFKYICDNNNSALTQVGCDLGFFKQNNQPNVKYFMIVRRWYQTGYDCPLAINYNLGSSYVNWKLTNYIDSTKVTKLSQDVIEYYLTEGEGVLFSLAPVIQYGGFLIDNETISGTNTLEDTLIIQSKNVQMRDFKN